MISNNPDSREPKKKRKKLKLSVIIPVYNEKSTVAEIVKRVQKVKFDTEIIIVDDGSTDGTKEILEKINDDNIIKLYHDSNHGKGAAIRTALKKVKGDFVIIQDADLEYDPDDYEFLFKPVKKWGAEVVYGSRFTGARKNMFFLNFVGNKVLTLLTNILYNTVLSDMETCYKLFRSDIILSLKLRAKRFDFEPEVTAKILKQGIRIWEVPISYAGREMFEGKKITWKDGIIALWCLIKYRFMD